MLITKTIQLNPVTFQYSHRMLAMTRHCIVDDMFLHTFIAFMADLVMETILAREMGGLASIRENN